MDNLLKNVDENIEIQKRFRSRIAREEDFLSDPEMPATTVATTGGSLFRVVGAVQLDDGPVEFSICTYETPGLYSLTKDGRTVGPQPRQVPYFLDRPRVEWTTRPAADGSTPEEPRWFWVDDGIDLHLTTEDVPSVCEPFKPEPFIQQIPEPITPTALPPK
ncbi:hypothetical protein [Rhodococcus marinonascens]|uniref:hypothetical protein n=1 Tax=Rhodococcus marinonascens TaxID=38311 RepID=UPI001114E3BF|nr:hypothetical protein [Rhodococcus marinonascens]